MIRSCFSRADHAATTRPRQTPNPRWSIASMWQLVLAALATLLLTLQPARAQGDLTPLRVQICPGAYTSMTVHVADEMGIFTRNKLKVEKIPAQSSSAAVAALIGGSLDVVETGAEFVLANQDKGVDIKYISANEVKNYATVIASTKVALPNLSKGYPAMMQDLKGLRVGVNAIGATLHLAALMMVSDAGLNKDDVQFVATGTGVIAWPV